MASPDPEKRAVFAIDNSHVSPPSRTTPSRSRRMLGYLAAVVAVLVMLSIAAASQRCAAVAPLAAGHGAPRAVVSRSTAVEHQESMATAASSGTPSPTVLKTFEVAQPVLMPDGPAESDGSTRHGEDYSPPLCSVLLMRHDFAWSYDAPFVGNYTPPDCEFNRVVLNFSAVSHGRQYDRLAIMYFGDTEVWRTSTAQPTPPPGISWIYLKDMTEYLYFWKSPQKIIFDLGNLINDKYTGIFNTTMTAIFYQADDVVTDQAPPSDLIIPISARRGANNTISRFMLPAENATNTLSLPRNIRRAVFSVSANGQASEEFWWSNVLQTDVHTFNATAGALPGLSPFREVQVLIDGQLAGVQWPFPVIFTGGVAPALHRPIVGIQAFDLREHEIDITPFLPLLCDGQPHTFTIRVAGLDSSADGTTAVLTETVNDSWYVTGKLFLWLSDGASPLPSAGGVPPNIHHPPPAITLTRALTTGPNGTNHTLTFTTRVERTLRITTASHPGPHPAGPFFPTSSWSQSLTYTNHAVLSAAGFAQHTNLTITGHDAASTAGGGGGPPPLPGPLHHPYYRAAYRYPLACDMAYAVSAQGNLSVSAALRQGREASVAGASVFATGLEASAAVRGRGLAARVETVREGTAEYRGAGDGRASTGWGAMRQGFWLGVGEGAGDAERGREVYWREVAAVNGTVVEDWRRMEGKTVVVDGGGGHGKRVVGGAVMEYA